MPVSSTFLICTRAIDGKGEYIAVYDADNTPDELIAQRAKDAGVTQVVFDRAGHQYHGRIAALADAAREAGLGL